MRLGFMKARASQHPVGKGLINTADHNTTDSIRPEHTALPPKENKEHYFKVFGGRVEKEVSCCREVSLMSANTKLD